MPHLAYIGPALEEKIELTPGQGPAAVRRLRRPLTAEFEVQDEMFERQVRPTMRHTLPATVDSSLPFMSRF
jgi:predicted Zn-dependent protease with MMP-like domain